MSEKKQPNKRQKLIQLIHIAKSKLSLADEEYKALLEGATKKTSCSNMTLFELELVMKAMRKAGFRTKRLPVKDDDRGMATEAQRKYIKGLWELVARNKTEEALHGFCSRLVGVKHLRFLTPTSATKIILALRKMAKDAGFDPDGIPGAGV